MPNVGEMVTYWGPTDMLAANQQVQSRVAPGVPTAALVTGVNGDGSLSLRVFPDKQDAFSIPQVGDTLHETWGGYGPLGGEAPAPPDTGGGGNGEPAAPTLTSISPTSGVIGATDITVTATGTGFTDASELRINGAAVPTTNFVSATEINGLLDPAVATEPATHPVTVMTDGVETAPQNFDWTY